MTIPPAERAPVSTPGVVTKWRDTSIRIGECFWFIAREILMNRILIGLAATQLMIIGAASHADALTAELAKKCRDMAIKSHPPPIPPGNKAYAQAERDFFRECVSRNGQMPDNGAPQDQSKPAQH